MPTATATKSRKSHPSRCRGISVMDYRHPYGVYVYKCEGKTAHLGYIVSCYDTDGNQVGSWTCPADHDTADARLGLSAVVRDREKWLKRTYQDWRNLDGAR